MKQAKLSSREIVLLIILAVLLIGIVYYMGFYTPMENEKNEIRGRIAESDMLIAAAQEKTVKMKEMEEELTQILSMPESRLTEIAAYDNKEAVLTMLNGILKQTRDYSLSFNDPAVQEDGTVRRVISMSFGCDDYRKAKAVLRDLSNSPWRCLVNNISIAGGDDLMNTSVSVSATVTFFESTEIKG